MSPTDTTDYVALQAWCREYDLWTPYPSGAIARFLIGMYQLPGARMWKGSLDNSRESLASTAIHMMIVGERLKLGTEAIVPRELRELFTRDFDDQKMLNELCLAAQQITYGNPQNRTARAKRRFRPEKLRDHLANIIRWCFGAIPEAARAQAILDSTCILVGAL